MLTVTDPMASYTRLTGVFLAVNQHVVLLPILMPESAGLLLSESKVMRGNSNRSKSDGRCLDTVAVQSGTVITQGAIMMQTSFRWYKEIVNDDIQQWV